MAASWRRDGKVCERCGWAIHKWFPNEKLCEACWGEFMSSVCLDPPAGDERCKPPGDSKGSVDAIDKHQGETKRLLRECRDLLHKNQQEEKDRLACRTWLSRKIDSFLDHIAD